AGGQRRAERVAAGGAGAGHAGDDLPDAVGVVDRAVGLHGPEAFVQVFVPVQHQVGAGLVQRAPHGVGAGVGGVRGRGEARVMPVGQGAAAVGGRQVRLEPVELGRALEEGRAAFAPAAVQHHHVPVAAQVVAVVAPGGVAGGHAEVAEV